MLRTCFSALALLLFCAGPAAGQSLNDARAAYRNNRVAEAETMAAALAANPAASQADRAGALTELARIDWMARGETDAAAAALEQIPASPERCVAAALALRIFREAGAPAEPLAAAREGVEDCTPAAAQELNVQRARTLMALNSADALAQAGAALNALEPAAAASPEVASARLSLALMRRDAGAAFTAWREYFWLTEADAPPALTAYAGRVEATFAAGLPADAGVGDVVALAGLLIRAGFTDDARLLAARADLGARAQADPDWRRAAAFLEFHQALRTLTLRVNRDIIAGRDGSYYQQEAEALISALMQRAGLSGEPQAALLEAYGAYGTLGTTSGYPSMHAGHVVQDDRMHVSQYGRDGDLRFIVLDGMLANGYESWLWDGWAEAGGWAPSDTTIVQVRSAYTDGPLNALRQVRPGAQRTRIEQDITQLETEERAALRRDGVASLPATARRLSLQGLDQIAARTDGDDDAFLAEHLRAITQYSIEAHEGRHALDKAEGDFSGPQLEYRAKLSQIAFADYPRLALASVAGQPLNETAHGQGNRRVLEGYRRWMRAHRREIAGFDRSLPTLAQLHLLTDAQIVAAARSLDPWARSH
ncbi:MAG: hypothetical protein KF700_06970 [Hyphomonadaceae bacterium]|nr:hypothetical protein [Hyphomonadaceae bacterium]